jgi:hypothetical protein
MKIARLSIADHSLKAIIFSASKLLVLSLDNQFIVIVDLCRLGAL